VGVGQLNMNEKINLGVEAIQRKGKTPVISVSAIIIVFYKKLNNL
jgi:hypothetical protein